MHRSRGNVPFLSILLALVVLVSLLGTLVACGQVVSQNFSQVDSGLAGGEEDVAEEPRPASAPDSEENDAPMNTPLPTAVIARQAAEEEGASSDEAEADTEPTAVAEVADDAGDDTSAADVEVAAVDERVEEKGGAESLDGEASLEGGRPRPQGGPAPLKGGIRDDNEQFQDYLTYLDSYQGQTARVMDVRERYFITVLDGNQQPLLDAHVSIYANETNDDGNNDHGEPIFEARTYAGGKTLFLPRALGVSDDLIQFRLVAEHGEQKAETVFARNDREYIELAIADTQAPDELKLDVLFLLDTTGSMADELGRIQETIDSIAQRIDNFRPRPTVRFGVVAYRDRGDHYVTRLYDFTDDVPTFRKLLNSFSADGGGDTPESLNEALHESIHSVQWNTHAVRIVFLVADAGPHLDYEDDYDYADEIQQAVARGVKIYPIAASNTDAYAEYVFRQLAQQTLAQFIFLTYQPGQSGGVPGESTSLQSGEQSYTVEKLDDLIVQVVQRELAAAIGVE